MTEQEKDDEYAVGLMTKSDNQLSNLLALIAKGVIHGESAIRLIAAEAASRLCRAKINLR